MVEVLTIDRCVFSDAVRDVVDLKQKKRRNAPSALGGEEKVVFKKLIFSSSPISVKCDSIRFFSSLKFYQMCLIDFLIGFLCHGSTSSSDLRTVEQIGRA